MSANPHALVEPHAVSVVIPVYGGERHLGQVVKELEEYVEARSTPDGHRYSVTEVLLVHDCGPDDSARVMRDLAASHDFVRPIWLSRNFGQHAATLAGMASAGGDWIVTMDEDGQHDPAYIAQMLDRAMRTQAAVVYASPTNGSAHGAFRDLTSRWSKRVAKGLSGGTEAPIFHSYRFILGEVGRSVAAYAGSGVYLDVALEWVSGTTVTTPIPMRDEGEDRRSGYSARTLMSHFWRMLLTGGTRPLRMVSILGCVFAVGGLVLAAFLVIRQMVSPAPVAGWTSLAVLVLVCTGVLLFSLGVIAEYIGIAVNMAMGKPLYLITQDRADGPLGRLPRD